MVRMSEVQFMRQFGINLRFLLADSLMTQKELAEDTGISESTISRYIRGEIMPTIKNAASIVYSLGCEWEELITTDMMR